MTELTPAERAAETKKRRTREKLLQAADALIRRDGLAVRAEDVAHEAGVSAATFYNVWPNKGVMYTEVFRELVLGSIDQKAIAESVHERGLPVPFVLIDYLDALAALLADRANLVRGVLIARLENPPQAVVIDDWIIQRASGGDVVRELARELLDAAMMQLDLSDRTPERDKKMIQSVVVAVQTMAQAALDWIAVGRTDQPVSYLATLILDLTATREDVYDAYLVSVETGRNVTGS